MNLAKNSKIIPGIRYRDQKTASDFRPALQPFKNFIKFIVQITFMAKTYNLMGLHFKYRLWIAEMNSHINFIRIFDDYVAELSSRKNEPAIKKRIEEFKQEFIDLRKSIDELRHELHLAKMSLGAESRGGRNGKKISVSRSIHIDLRNRYRSYRKVFEKTKTEFSKFENKWL